MWLRSRGETVILFFSLFLVCAVLFPGVVNSSFSEVESSLLHANVQSTAEMDLSLRPLSRRLMSVFRKIDDISCMFCEHSVVITFSEIHNTIKTLFIVPTDAHYYKIIEMLKQFKIITLAPTCFGSRRNRHQGAVLCLAKTTNMVFLCSSVWTQSLLWWHISLLC